LEKDFFEKIELVKVLIKSAVCHVYFKVIQPNYIIQEQRMNYAYYMA